MRFAISLIFAHVGAWIKRTVRQDIIDNRPPGRKTVKTQSDHILSPQQVCVALSHYLHFH